MPKKKKKKYQFELMEEGIIGEYDLWEIADNLLPVIDRVKNRLEFRTSGDDEYINKKIVSQLKKEFKRLKIKVVPS